MLQRTERASELGRTMFEMLAVVAIIILLGYLSLGMYNFAMDTQKAGALHDDFRVRAALNIENKGKKFSTAMKNTSTYDLPMNVTADSPAKGYFLVQVDGVKKGICKKLLSKIQDDIDKGKMRAERIYINNAVYPEGIASCPSEAASVGVAFKSATGPGQLSPRCMNNDPCGACESCQSGECRFFCPSGTICHGEGDEKACVAGSCNNGLCCPTTLNLCQEGDDPAGDATHCPCLIKQSECSSCTAGGICQDDNRWCHEHSHCDNGSCVCDSNYILYNGACSSKDTELANGCTLEKPIRYNDSCYACTQNRQMLVFSSTSTDKSRNYGCEEICPNRQFWSGYKCGGAPANQSGVCSLKTPPNNYPVLGCTGQWRACPTKTDTALQVSSSHCISECSNSFAMELPSTSVISYCYHCDLASNVWMKEYAHVAYGSRCPNRIWDTNNCQHYKSGSWQKCGTNGTYAECSGSANQKRCSFRLKKETDCPEGSLSSTDCTAEGLEYDVVNCTCKCPAGEIYYNDGTGYACVAGSCTNGLCCPTVNRLCEEGDTPAGDATHCPCDLPVECGDCGECGVCNPRTGMCDTDDDTLCSSDKMCYNMYCSTCEDGKIQSTEGNKACVACNINAAKIAKTTANECKRCGAVGFYFDGVNDCHGCNGASVSAYGTTAAWCARCKATNSKRYYWAGTCAICDGVNGTFNADETECIHTTYPNDKFFTVEGKYLGCNSTSNKRTSEADCHTCNNRFWQKGTGYTTSQCYSCQHNGWILLSGVTVNARVAECHRCSDRAIDTAGNCFWCLTTDPKKIIGSTNIDASECARCQAINPRIYYIASTHKCKLCTQDLVDGVCPD